MFICKGCLELGYIGRDREVLDKAGKCCECGKVVAEKGSVYSRWHELMGEMNSRPTKLWYKKRENNQNRIAELKQEIYCRQAALCDGMQKAVYDESKQIIRDLKTKQKNMEKQIKMSLDTAREIYKEYKFCQEIKGALTISLKAIVSIIEQNFTKEELEGKEGYSWEDSFTGCGYEINQQYGAISRIFTEGDYNKNDVRHAYKTKEQAESALAFAQLSHIVAKYNENKVTHSIWGSSVSSTIDGELTVVEVHKKLCLLVFITEEDAKTSLKVNHQLWLDYWMITKSDNWDALYKRYK